MDNQYEVLPHSALAPEVPGGGGTVIGHPSSMSAKPARPVFKSEAERRIATEKLLIRACGQLEGYLWDHQIPRTQDLVDDIFRHFNWEKKP